MKTYPSCSLCIHFEPNKSTWTLLNKETKPLNQDYPASCVESGHFIRDINVLLDSYHFFAAMNPYHLILKLIYLDCRQITLVRLCL